MNPKILVVVDVPGWALDRTAQNVIVRLESQYQFELIYADQAAKRIPQGGYDLLYVTYWMLFLNRAISVSIPEAAVSAVRSHFKWDGGVGNPPSAAMLQEIARYRAIHVPSKLLYEVFKDKHSAVFYTPHGVDSQVFVPSGTSDQGSPAGRLILGWAGSKANHPGKRGLEDFLLPAIADLEGVELRFAAREDRWRTQEEMVEFYQELDAYICCSRTEGGPHPVLEASSCGLPIISTPVGIVPELLQDGSNGFLVERKIEAIREAVIRLRDDRSARLAMGRRAREVIEESWNWDIQAPKYRPFFDYALERAHG